MTILLAALGGILVGVALGLYRARDKIEEAEIRNEVMLMSIWWGLEVAHGPELRDAFFTELPTIVDLEHNTISAISAHYHVRRKQEGLEGP